MLMGYEARLHSRAGVRATARRRFRALPSTAVYVEQPRSSGDAIGGTSGQRAAGSRRGGRKSFGSRGRRMAGHPFASLQRDGSFVMRGAEARRKRVSADWVAHHPQQAPIKLGFRRGL
jgi:hypothetical protein